MQIARVETVLHGGTVHGVRSAGTRPTERHGLFLRLTTKAGSIGTGEASPLPGFSRETLVEARAALSAFDWERLPEPTADVPPSLLVDDVAKVTAELPPSARFAIDTAVLDLAGQARRLPLWAVLDAAWMDTEWPSPGSQPAEPVPLSAFLGAATDLELPAAARAAVARGIRSVKIKLTGPIAGPELDAIRAVRSAIGSRALRLDANGSIPPGDVVPILESLTNVAPEFIEEPTGWAELPSYDRLPVPLALDESLHDEGAWRRLSPHLVRLGCVTLVLKPMALGGFAPCFELARRARLLGFDVVLSHLFDGPVALAACAHLALAIASRSRASGLDRHGGLAAFPELGIPGLLAARIEGAAAPGLGLNLDGAS